MAKMIKSSQKISDSAVKKATGYTWLELHRFIAGAEIRSGNQQWSHKQIVSYLKAEHSLSAWWFQSAAVAYEKDSGRRQIGETADVGFEIGVQKTVTAPKDEVWELLTGPHGLSVWLRTDPNVALKPGEKFITSDGTSGEFRVVKEYSHLRLTWKRANWSRPSILQVRVSSKGEEKTTIGFHQEKLGDAATRGQMKEHWKKVQEELKLLLRHSA
jgi:uncharacterized protein YndB with AHSA1/START domain